MNAPTCALCDAPAEVGAIISLEFHVVEAPLCRSCLDDPSPTALSRLSSEVTRSQSIYINARGGAA